MEVANYNFTKSHTQIAKGIAIILMICHHLFAFPNRLHNVNYISIIPFSDNYYEYLLGGFGYICVPMFLFLSGYGLYISYIKNSNFTFTDSMKKMRSFLMNYWTVFILFIPIGLIWFNDDIRYSWDFGVFVSNFFVLSSSYNGEWWFARLYIELLLLFPIIKYLLNKNTMYVFITSILLCFMQSKSDMLFKLLPQSSFLKKSFLYNDIKNMLLWQVIFVVGCIVAKYDLFKVINIYFGKKKLDKNILYILLILIVVVARLKIRKFIDISPTYLDMFITPIFILLCTNVINASKTQNIFIVSGKNSGNMWLTHTFFIYYYFQSIVFYPKLSILIVIWVCFLSIASSVIINIILLKLNNINHYMSLKIKRTITIINDM